MHAGASAVAVVDGPVPPWPAEIPDALQAESELGAALAARVADAAAVVTRVVGEMTEIERSAFDGIAVAEPTVLKAASALRLQLAAALDTAPQSGEFDPDAVQQLLSSADEVLAALAQESASAPEQVAAAIGTIRTDLVRDAIRVSEAHQRLANPRLAPAAAAVSSAAPRVRVLSNESEDAPAVRERSRRNLGLWVTLLVAVLAAGGYHVNRAYELKRATAAMIRVDGAPERVLAGADTRNGQLLFTPPGAPLTTAELQRLVDAQKARGRTVTQREPGVYVVQKERKIP